MNILHLSIVVYIGNGDGVGALRRRRSDVAASTAYTHAHIHMNMSYLSIILFCISDAVFRFAFFFGQLLCFFLGDFTQTHTYISVLFLHPVPPPTLFSLSQALLLLLPDVSLSLLLLFVLSHLLSCSLSDLSLDLACCCCCCSAYSSAATIAVVVLSPSAMPAAPSLVVVVLIAAFHGCCLSYFESAN